MLAICEKKKKDKALKKNSRKQFENNSTPRDFEAYYYIYYICIFIGSLAYHN